MIGKLISTLLNWSVSKKIAKELKDLGISASIGKIKITIPLEIESNADEMFVSQAKNSANDLINKKIEPMFKGKVDFEIDIQKKPE